MELIELIILLIIFFVTSIIGVITGSNSLITVPVLFGFDIDPRVAVATNMFALTFLSIGGSIPFLGKGMIETKRLPMLVGLTLLGSVIGALLVLFISSEEMKFIVPVFMLALVIFSFWNPNAGMVTQTTPASTSAELTGYVLTFLLGIYGGFFSGGYVTLLTTTYIVILRMTYMQAVSITKVINVFSSLVATCIFIWKGLVDFKLGIMLAIIMFIGGLLGARIALKLNNQWVRRIFLLVVIVLALKTLLYDIIWEAIK